MKTLFLLVWLSSVLGLAFACRSNLSSFLFYLRLDHENDWIRLGRLRELGWMPLDFNVVLALAYRAAIGKEQLSARVTRFAKNSVYCTLAFVIIVGILPCAVYIGEQLIK